MVKTQFTFSSLILLRRIDDDSPIPELSEVYTAEVEAGGLFGEPITLQDKNVGSQATLNRVSWLYYYQYRDTFAKNLTKLGCTNKLWRLTARLHKTDKSSPTSCEMRVEELWHYKRFDIALCESGAISK